MRLPKLLKMSTFAVGFGLLALTSPAVFADAAAGQTLFTAKCKTCHGATGQGNPGMAKVLKADIRDLGAVDVQKKSDDELKKNSTEGIGKMKPVAGLSPADAANVVAYIRTLKK